MNFLKKMPIATKIFLIPGIAALSFVLYLLITIYTALNNGDVLEEVQQVQVTIPDPPENPEKAKKNVKD